MTDKERSDFELKVRSDLDFMQMEWDEIYCNEMRCCGPGILSVVRHFDGRHGWNYLRPPLLFLSSFCSSYSCHLFLLFL